MLFITAIGFSQNTTSRDPSAIDPIEDFPVEETDTLSPTIDSSNNTVELSSNNDVVVEIFNITTNGLILPNNTISFNGVEELILEFDIKVTYSGNNLESTFGQATASYLRNQDYADQNGYIEPIHLYNINCDLIKISNNFYTNTIHKKILLRKNTFYAYGDRIRFAYASDSQANNSGGEIYFNITGGTNVIGGVNFPPTGDFSIQEIKFSDDSPILNNNISISTSAGRAERNDIFLDITFSSNFTHGNKITLGYYPYVTSIQIINPSGTKFTIGYGSLTTYNGLTTFKNIKIDSSLPIESGAYIKVFVGFQGINRQSTTNITFTKTKIKNILNHDHKFIAYGSNLNIINNAATADFTPPCLTRGCGFISDIRTITIYKWQYKPEGTISWIDVPGQTTKDLTFPNITTNMLIKRVAYYSNEYVESKIISVCVNNLTVTNSVCCDQTTSNISSQPEPFTGTIINTSLPFEYRWEYSTIQGTRLGEQGSPWEEIINPNINNLQYIYTSTDLRATKHIKFRRIIIQNQIVKNISNNVSLIRSFATGRITETKEDIAEVKKSEESNELTIFPNPTKDNLNIELPNNNYKNLTIVNILGEIVKECTIISQKNLIIDMSSYNPGVYFLTLEDNLGTKQTRKIIKE